MSEALQLVIDYGFNVMHLHRIEALIDPDNLGSRSVLEKGGFVFEGTLRDNEYYKGEYHTTASYAKLDTDKD